MGKNRIIWIDIAKVLGIYLMIIGHRDLVSDEWTRFIFTFHMPLFFVISGMFWRPLPFKETFLKSFRSLIIPFLIITLFWCLYYFVCYVKGGIPLRQMMPYILGSFVSPGKDFLFLHPLCVYLWFLIALVVIRLFCSLIHHKVVLALLSFVLFVIDVIISIKGIVLPFALDSAMLALPFFVIGYLTSSLLTKSRAVYWDIIVFIVSAFLAIVIGSRNGVVDICFNLFGNNVFFYLVSGFCGAIMIFSFSRMLSECMLKSAIYNSIGKFLYRFVNILAKGLLLVVGFSAFITGLYRGAITFLIPALNTNNNQFGLILGGAVLISFYSLTIICQKIFPAILGFRK